MVPVEVELLPADGYDTRYRTMGGIVGKLLSRHEVVRPHDDPDRMRCEHTQGIFPWHLTRVFQYENLRTGFVQRSRQFLKSPHLSHVESIGQFVDGVCKHIDS